ncbi:MAG: regulatory iron-sulfur-containing complex subunit RicT [Candidatus Gastranaerophilaceae bacterium]|jgi:cell fate regulator YaaT (PSP1 superfamily)
MLEENIMDSYKYNNSVLNGNGKSNLEFKSKFEIFDADIVDLFDELIYIREIPKSGYSKHDFLVRNGHKYTAPTNAEYFEVVFKGNGKKVFHNINNLTLKLDDFVVVESEDGNDLGRVIDYGSKTELKLKCSVESCICIHNLIRQPDLEELKLFNRKFADEHDVLITTRDIVDRYGFDMKVTEAHWQIDRQRLTIYFTAPQRIDFRELVKDLARTFKSRIELRQISSREEAKRLGAFVGPCGRECCCTTFMTGFDHVTLEHAKIQQLSNNVSKLSGNCGRLKCCIKFEHDTYSEVFEKFPPPHSIIEADEGILKVVKVDIFNEIATTYCEVTSSYKTFKFCELQRYIDDGKVHKPMIEYDRHHEYHNNEELLLLE